MSEILIILEPSIAEPQRQAVMRAAPPTQSISNRVFITASSTAAVDLLRSMPGVASVLTGSADSQHLPQLNDAESLFVQAWLSKAGQVKQRPGEGLDWDAPPMRPPDRHS